MTGWVTLTDDDTELEVSIGNAIVFDPTGRDLVSELVVGIVTDFAADDDRATRPVPLVQINGTVQLCAVTRAKALLS